MGNVELERTSYIGFVSGKFEFKHFYNIFCIFYGGKKLKKKIIACVYHASHDEQNVLEKVKNSTPQCTAKMYRI
jgi:hypothetical protein